jgi:hypothetical protein
MSFIEFSRYTSKSPYTFTPSSKSDYRLIEYKANNITLSFSYIVTKLRALTLIEILVSKDTKES